MEAFFLPILKRFYLVAIPIFFSYCNHSPRQVNRSFYYWKTTFGLSENESKALKELRIQNLYVRLFDVEWNEATSNAAPVSPIRFSSKPPHNIFITPVVFITNETIGRLPAKQIDALATNINKLMSSISKGNQLHLSNEVQIDCDWTAGTKEKYFQLLNSLRRQAFFKSKQLSCTIRLHQLKFISINGVPPVDKGLLMCYNMGNLRHASTGNSIIETSELKKYTNNMKSYPLALDVALPIFEWHVWFKGEEYKGLIHKFPELKTVGNRINFTKDTTIEGIHFTKEDWLRWEESNIIELIEAAQHLSEKTNKENVNVILYHLSEDNINKYKRHELENIFDSFR